ncbi:protein TONSOKU isoform X1 [Canna indica]|uniref:Protein TONSOKU n=1 Tax=Canna indica TaxID=4628 RepID=A0AAQ3JTZ2_9LILI|nr:protein TONSOKU isoform X1 [Canna indica]
MDLTYNHFSCQQDKLALNQQDKIRFGLLRTEICTGRTKSRRLRQIVIIFPKILAGNSLVPFRLAERSTALGTLAGGIGRGGEMRRGEDDELRVAKRGYKEAARVGNHEEEARWANEIGDIHKRRGEYVEALRWLRIDYEVSSKHLPQKQLLPTCQSIGEVYLRLNRLKEALVYQKKHLQLSKDSDDLIEQQRATTQLGRTYHEIFTETETDHHAMRNAKKYFKSAMKLARSLKENPPCMKSGFFLKEFIDAHNNIGMLEMDLDNYEEAEKILLQGLKICDDEEVSEYDDARSRLHHNLGYLYTELREWSKARAHIEKDILICKKICHLQGEAKGFINLGELHHRVQKYDDAIRCYQTALDTAKCLEDEDALVNQINQNMNTVKEAAKVLEELKKDEQKLKKLMRTTCDARGTSNERKCLLEQSTCLDGLIEKACVIFAWPKHLEFAKRKKRVSSELCDKEKLSDAYLVIGESYLKLRNFSRARKWYMKSWNVYRSIGDLEGQALVKINIGQVLDASGDWAGALEAFEQVQGNMLSVQMTALDNMHYSHMIRFDNVDEARKLQLDIGNLKPLLKGVLDNQYSDYCSETETEGGDSPASIPTVSALQESDGSAKSRSILPVHVEEFDEDAPLASIVRLSKNSAKTKKSQLDSHVVKSDISANRAQASSRDLSKSNDDQQQTGRKRTRVVISDDEADDLYEMDESKKRPHRSSIEHMNRPQKRNCGYILILNIILVYQDCPHSSNSRDILSASAPIHIEESTCSFKCKSPTFTADNGADFGSSSDVGIAVASKSAASESKLSGGRLVRFQQSQNDAGFNLLKDDHRYIKFKLGHDLIHVDISSCLEDGYLNIECVKVEVACSYFLQLPEQKRSKGLLPVIGCLKICGTALGSSEPIEDIKNALHENNFIQVVIDGWVPKRLIKLYIDSCEKLSEPANMNLLKKLYNLEVSEDEVIVSDCGLQDVSITPFLNALQVHKTVAVLDISHNMLGNETMEKIQLIFNSSRQKYGGLTLDLHCNRFGPTALFQICECSVLSSRLEVLNLAKNRLTDACSSYLSTILENCKALYSLNIEQCSITSRTIERVADALSAGSVLSHLSIGNNNPISGNAIINLLTKLQSLKRFSELSLAGIRLNKSMTDSLCQFARSSNITVLKLGGTYIGNDGSISLTEALCTEPQELVRLDLSYCGLTSFSFAKACQNLIVLSGLVEMNIGGNCIDQEGCKALVSFIADSKSSLKSIILNNCQLGLTGIIQIIQALADNESLEELHLGENADVAKEITLQKPDVVCEENVESNGLEVADSEDEAVPGASCASSCQKNSYVHQLILDLCDAIISAKNLLLLDLSRNKFSKESIDLMYAAWSSSRCNGNGRKHGNKDVVHFSVDGIKCCGVKPCCRRD